MSQQTTVSRKGSNKNSPSASPKRSSNQRKAFNSPKRAQIEPSKLLYAPRPYSRQDSLKTVQKPEFNTAVKSQNSTQPAKKGSSYKKPAVPPKPRNVIVKQRSNTKLRKSGEILSKKTNVLLEDKSEQNDSGLSGKRSLFLSLFIAKE